MSVQSLRLANLPLAAKLMLTAFLALLGTGYLVATRNIYEQHHEADLEPGLSMDDLRRAYHGLNKEVTEETQTQLPSTMQRMVAPGAPMRMYLERGGPPAVRTLTTWLENGSREVQFPTTGLVEPGDPSPRQVITRQCVLCHNATDGEMMDVPYAQAFGKQAEYDLVIAAAEPVAGPTTTETAVMELAPTGRAELVHITHAHILAMPIFTLCVGTLFLLTGLPQWLKTIVGPLPMIALCFDIGAWWLTRVYEPGIFIIATAGAVFGLAYGIQIIAAFLSLWFGRRTTH